MRRILSSLMGDTLAVGRFLSYIDLPMVVAAAAVMA
jgi:hypothetical protein